MAPDTSMIFISYSRKDAEFALRLGNDLKAKGVNVWLDQLDIKPGKVWDNEVERALEKSEKFLIILTPESVASVSVKDELSFALDEHKEIIPVLMKECKVPFRIRRRQHIDFSKDYEAGLNILLKSYSLQQQTATSAETGKTTSVTVEASDLGIAKTLQARMAGQKNKLEEERKATPKTQRRHTILILLIFITISIIVLFIWQPWKNNPYDKNQNKMANVINPNNKESNNENTDSVVIDKPQVLIDTDNNEGGKKSNEESKKNVGIIWTDDKSGYFVDPQDQVKYKVVKIGTQIWMAENLKATKYNDGTAIQLVTDSMEWSQLTTAAYCWYDNDEAATKSTYGALYNWHAVNTGKLCPTGWHVPSDDEWKQLVMSLGLSKSVVYKRGVRGTDEVKILKSTSGWNKGGNGTDKAGFTALPGGYRDGSGNFANLGNNGSWWSAMENNSTKAWCRRLYYNSGKVFRNDDDKNYGFSVRCVRD